MKAHQSGTYYTPDERTAEPALSVHTKRLNHALNYTATLGMPVMRGHAYTHARTHAVHTHTATHTQTDCVSVKVVTISGENCGECAAKKKERKKKITNTHTHTQAHRNVMAPSSVTELF